MRGPWTIVVGLALVVAGCGSDGGGEASSSTSSETAQVVGEPQSVEDLCGYEASGDYLELRTESGDSVMPGYTMGEGEDAVVLLAQLTGRGSCDWIGYAEWLADQGVRVLAVDLCGIGKARCADDLDADPAAQLELAIGRLRADGSQRVTVLGASMGAAIAQGAGQQAGADAIIAVSPPPKWDDVDDVDTAAGEITVPWLLVAAQGDDIDPPRLKAARTGASAPGEYRQLPGSDHGYALLTDGTVLDPELTSLGKEMPRWITGELPQE